MDSAPDPHASGAVPLRRRSAAGLLALGVHALLLLMLLSLTPAARRVFERPSEALTVQSFALPRAAPERSKAVARAKEAGGGAAAKPAPPARAPLPPPPEPAVAYTKLWAGMEDFDLARLGPAPSHGSGAGTGRGDDEGPGDGTGDGPGGERLYNPDWYRKPSHAELAAYLPRGDRRTGWGMIACRTIADFRVDDCREIGQEPAGSGLSRAVRQAAWQFRVRPPRIGGRPLTGAWVRIRIEFTEGVAS